MSSVIYLDYWVRQRFPSVRNGLEINLSAIWTNPEFTVITTPIPHLPWISGVSRLEVMATSPSLELLLWRQRHPTVLSAAADFPYTTRRCFRRAQSQTDFWLVQGSLFEDGIIICLGMVFLNNISFFSMTSLFSGTIIWKYVFCFSWIKWDIDICMLVCSHPYLLTNLLFSPIWCQILLKDLNHTAASVRNHPLYCSSFPFQF